VSTHLQHRSTAELSRLFSLTPDDLDIDRGDDGDVVENLVLLCSDGHFLDFVSTWARDNFGGRADTLSAPGGPLELCHDLHMVEEMLRRARILHGLHSTEDIWMIFHNRCGGYAKYRRTTDLVQERYHQLQDMLQIERLLEADGLLAAGTQLHFAILRTKGPAFVPLGELVDQAERLGLDIEALRRDLNVGLSQLPNLAACLSGRLGARTDKPYLF
jgi:hypothetical protein